MLTQLECDADQVVSFLTSSYPVAVGRWHDNFDQTPDKGVANLLRGHATAGGPVAARSHCLGRGVAIRTDGSDLEGRHEVVAEAQGIDLFARASGRSRHCRRNQSLVRRFRAHRLGMPLFDLLTPTETPDRRRGSDVALLGSQLEAVTALIRRQPEVGTLTRCYLWASPGAAAALWAAGSPDNDVSATVSRGGRADRCTT
jgi:putative phosphoribosyl transferase